MLDKYRGKDFLRDNSKCKSSEQHKRWGRWRIYRPSRLLWGLCYYLSEQSCGLIMTYIFIGSLWLLC